MTAVAPWGENAEDAYDQGLVEMGLGDSRLIEVQGAFLPMGFEATPPQPLPMGSLVECHLATSYAYNGGTACAGVAWAACTTPEGEECAIVAKITTELDYEETESLLKRNLQRRLASRDLEVVSFDVAVDEVTAAQDHFGVAMAALILPESLKMSGGGNVGRVRSGLTRQVLMLWLMQHVESTPRHLLHLQCDQVAENHLTVVPTSRFEVSMCTWWFAAQVANVVGV